MSEKTPSKSGRSTRRHEHQLTIAAAPEAVWKAITDAAELVNWFPLRAEVRPGSDGAVTYDWGGEVVGVCRIAVWEPPRHLCTAWMEPALPEGEAAGRAPTAVDWIVEGQGGRTVIRLVHSGFGRDADWDAEFDGTRRGWAFELRSLKHYLERHAGVQRRAFWVRQPAAAGAGAVWSRFGVAGGLFREADVDRLSEGDRYRLQLPTGETLEGVVRLHAAPTDFAGTLTSHNDGLFRFGYEEIGGRPEAHLWVSTWGVSAGPVEGLERACREAMRRAFA